MSSVNRVIIIGRLGQDPEVRKTEGGIKVVTLSVATSEKWTDKANGEKKERTEWHRVVIWGSRDNDGLAGTAEKFLKKGHQAYLSGKLQTRKWQAQDGTDRYTTEIVLNGFGAELVLLESQGSGGNRPPPANSPDEYGRQSSGKNSAPSGDYQPGSDDDIPF
jgi:single-strand DNA-binding protein